MVFLSGKSFTALVYHDDIFFLFIVSSNFFNLASYLVNVGMDLLFQLLEVILTQQT